MTQEEKDKSVTALRFNTNKPKWSLVHYASLVPMVRALEYGANKYTPDNWKKGGRPLKEPLECLQRHLAALMDGEEIDQESGCTHIGLLMCNAMFYSYFTQTTAGEVHKMITEPNTLHEAVKKYMGINGPDEEIPTVFEMNEVNRIRKKVTDGFGTSISERNYVLNYDIKYNGGKPSI